MTRTLISILNWNSSDATLLCIKSIYKSIEGAGLNIFIRVIDNGSSTEEFNKLSELKSTYKSIDVVGIPINLGFTGGQNLNIQYAIDNAFEYVWLLNNDTIIHSQCLCDLIDAMSSDIRCGASSPIVLRLGSPDTVDFCGAVHAWSHIDTIRPSDISIANKFIANNEKFIWAVGTALLIRISALRDVGLLDDRYFAYYEDDDFGERLINHGWRTRIVLSAKVEHACFEGDIYQRQPYFFYLMNRNSYFFAEAHAPAGYRRFLKLRYIDRSIFMANRLLNLGYLAKSNACLLGLADGLSGKAGPPDLTRTVPLWLKIVRPFFHWWNFRKH